MMTHMVTSTSTVANPTTHNIHNAPGQKPRLPIELCERIIDASSHTLRLGSPTTDHATLRACALVCRAWLPRARHNLFWRVAVRSTRALSALARAGAAGPDSESASRTQVRPHELQLTVPLRLGLPPSRAGRLAKTESMSTSPSKQQNRRNTVPDYEDDAGSDPSDANISLVDPRLAPALSAVSTLTLLRSEWLFPPRYVSLFCAQFSSPGAGVATGMGGGLRELRLHHAFFVTARDLVGLLWGFPGLQVLECFRAIVKFGNDSAVVGSHFEFNGGGVGIGTRTHRKEGVESRLPPVPRRTRTGDLSGPCSRLTSLKVGGTSVLRQF